MNRVSFYGFLFRNPVDHILRYDILWRPDKNKYLLKYTALNCNFENPTQDIVVMVYDSLYKAIAGIIGRFRNIEIEQDVYKNLKPVSELSDSYHPWINSFQDLIISHQIQSFSIFGHSCKYNSRTEATAFLKSLGYFTIATKPPHVYVLDDFIKEEQQRMTYQKPG